MDPAAKERLYRLISVADWNAARRQRVVAYADHDRRDGFMHLSTGAQVLETAERYFSGWTDLLALEIDVDAVAADVKFEAVASRGDAVPHLYGELPVAAVIRARQLSRQEDGTFAFGGEAAP
jgi:uncharacterized protein (DUF952 family)